MYGIHSQVVVLTCRNRQITVWYTPISMVYVTQAWCSCTVLLVTSTLWQHLIFPWLYTGVHSLYRQYYIYLTNANSQLLKSLRLTIWLASWTFLTCHSHCSDSHAILKQEAENTPPFSTPFWNIFLHHWLYLTKFMTRWCIQATLAANMNKVLKGVCLLTSEL